MLETQNFSKAQDCPEAAVLNPTCTVVDDSGNSVHEVEFKNTMSIAIYWILICDFPAGFVCYILFCVFCLFALFLIYIWVFLLPNVFFTFAV